MEESHNNSNEISSSTDVRTTSWKNGSSKSVKIIFDGSPNRIQSHEVLTDNDDNLTLKSSIVEEEKWVQNFMDLIYVAVIYAIELIFNDCGDDIDVYLITASFFYIMFSTRLQIDVYSICFLANDLMHRLVILVYSCGVYIMAMNIAITIGESNSNGYLNYGFCEQNYSYTVGFGSSFIFTRLIMIILYTMQIKNSYDDESLEIYRFDCILKIIPHILAR